MQSSPRPTDTGTVQRAGFIGILIAAAFLLLLLRILKYQTLDYDKYRNKVQNQITTEAEVIAERGKIYDRNGVDGVWCEDTKKACLNRVKDRLFLCCCSYALFFVR